VKDYLWLHLRDLPYFRALVRSVEARFYKDIELVAPTLDLGCGDGHFASIAFDRPLEVGIDPRTGPLREAARRNHYRLLLQGDGGSLPFPGHTFASVVSNSVLEHIPHLDKVLAEVARILQPGGLFVFCVPNNNFLLSLSVSQGLERMRLSTLADLYRTFFNRISRHYHCDPPEIWQEKLDEAGFNVQRWWHYFSPQALKVVEWGHYFGFPALVSHWLTGRWIISASGWNLYFTSHLVRPYYDQDPICDHGVYSFYIARKR
jgi:SAM-dependent methyltransferase